MKTAYEILKDNGLMNKNVLAASLNGETIELGHEVPDDAAVAPLTFEDEAGRKVLRHTASHVLAAAVKRLYPEAKLTIGPAIDDGFYYDIDSDIAFSPDILAKLEAEMAKIIKEDPKEERFTLPRDEAKKLMEDRGEPYKVLLIDRVPEGEDISFYRQGEFVDLCAGPHLFSVGAIKAFKLTQCTGAYWEGNSKNKVLQRIYGTAFTKKAELEEYLARIAEAEKRDHNKLGRELEFFTTVDYIGQGLPILLPKGAKTIQVLQRFVEDEEARRGYQLTKTPFFAKSDLYKISGHWDHYLDGMFVMGDPNDDSKECFALRPMTCPFQYQVFLNRMRSYRDMPMRLGETSTLFRNEDSGEMHGLIRVRQFTISEGHIMCTPEQLEGEFDGCVKLIQFMMKAVGFENDVTYRFSQWDPSDRKKYIGTPEQWDEAQSIMEKILKDLGLKYSIGIGEAAFYGPKLDVQMKNVHGKEDTLCTVQIDQMLAPMFGMEYTDRDGTKKSPYILHRTSLGCYERTLAMLIEKYAGALPMWMAPEQIRVLPIGVGQHEYAESVKAKLDSYGFRTTIDERNEKIGYKIREAQLEKLPYMLIIGDKEMENGEVAPRRRTEGDIGAMQLDDFIAKANKEVAERVLDF